MVGVNREVCAKYKRALDGLLPREWSEVVYTESPADKIERPFVAELQLSEEREKDIRSLFKKPAENPKILIVRDKLLTGYDAPVLYRMYLDKPMRDHVLVQAIARVNRHMSMRTVSRNASASSLTSSECFASRKKRSSSTRTAAASGAQPRKAVQGADDRACSEMESAERSQDQFRSKARVTTMTMNRSTLIREVLRQA